MSIYRCRSAESTESDAEDVNAPCPAIAAERFAEMSDRDGGEGYAPDQEVWAQGSASRTWMRYTVIARLVYSAERAT